MVSKENDGKITVDENAEKVDVSRNSYLKVIKFLGGFWFMSCQIIVLLAFQGARALLDYTIGHWSRDPVTQQTQYKFYITLIFSIAGFAGIMKLLIKLMTMLMSVRMSRNVHAQLIKRVMCAPINLFYDVTPVGQILNRFSSDLSFLDDNVANNLSNILEMLLNVV